MKILAVVLSLILVPAAFAIERTARPVFDSSRELAAMLMVPVCAQGTPIVVSGTRLVCGQNLAGQTCPANQAIAGFNAQGNIVCRAISTPTPPPVIATGCGSCPPGYPYLLNVGARCSSNNDTFVCGR